MNYSKDLIEFYEQCLTVLDRQEFLLETREAKLCALQSFRHVLKEYVAEHGIDFVEKLIRVPTQLPMFEGACG